MSHFTVMVIGENPEKQLAPYDESISVPPYENGVVTDEDIQSFTEYYTKKNPEDSTLSFEELYEKYGEEWNGGSWKKGEDGVLHDYSTYNPKSKWDWYSVGGRWTGYFKLKDGCNGELGVSGVSGNKPRPNHADEILKGDIDIEVMKIEAHAKATEEYEKVLNAFGGVIPKDDFSWGSLFDGTNNDIPADVRREKYSNQPSQLKIAEVRQNGSNEVKELLGWGFELDDYQCTKEEYANRASNDVITPFAFVKDGVWHEKGKMGWFACVSDEKEATEWASEFITMFESLPDDTLITVYDCHI